ncbi:MAG: YgaP-like transmembrane domain [Algibacter sp.]
MAFGLFYYFNVIEGTLANILITLAVIFLITSYINFCPLYSLILK